MDWIKINENEAWTDFLLHEYTYRDDVKRKLDNLAKDYWHSSFDSLVETCTADSTRISEIICKAFKVARWGFYDELRNMCPEWYKGKLQLDVLSNLRIPPGFNDWYDRSKKTGLIREIAKAYENNDPCLESRTGNESKEKVRCHLNTCIKLFQKDVDYLKGIIVIKVHNCDRYLVWEGFHRTTILNILNLKGKLNPKQLPDVYFAVIEESK